MVGGVLAAAMVPVMRPAANALTALASGFQPDRQRSLAVLRDSSVLVGGHYSPSRTTSMVVIGTLVCSQALRVHGGLRAWCQPGLGRRCSPQGTGHDRRGDALIGWLYDISIGTLVVVVIAERGPGDDIQKNPTTRAGTELKRSGGPTEQQVGMRQHVTGTPTSTFATDQVSGRPVNRSDSSITP